MSEGTLNFIIVIKVSTGSILVDPVGESLICTNTEGTGIKRNLLYMSENNTMIHNCRSRSKGKSNVNVHKHRGI
jgi:hypothetical protein